MLSAVTEIERVTICSLAHKGMCSFARRITFKVAIASARTSFASMQAFATTLAATTVDRVSL